MTAQTEALETALERWARQRREVSDCRDPLVLAAVAAGVSKHRVHVLTGIARSTIDQILTTSPATAGERSE